MLSKNVINEVIKEWSWRVPTGTPDVKNTKHLNILRDLLIKDFGASTYTVNQVIHTMFEARLSAVDKFANKHKDWLDELQAQLLYAALKKKNKLSKFQKYLDALPGGDPAADVKEAINSFTEAEMTEFALLLWSKTKPVAGGYPSSGAAGALFDLKPSGAGRGEMWLGALIKNSTVQGGGESYDLAASGGPYEVKDYQGTNKSAIRAGVEAAITKFHFWKQIVKTIDVIDEMETQGYWDLLDYKLSPMMPGIVASLIIEKKYLIQRGYSKIITGEFNSTGDYPSMKKFYETANQLLQADPGGTFDQITLTGTGTTDKTYAIADIDPSKFSTGKKITLDLLGGDAAHGLSIESVFNLLRTLDYVKNPSNFDIDINTALQKIIEGGQAKYWIIFRKNGMKVIEAKVSNFTYKAISQNGVKFAELD